MTVSVRRATPEDLPGMAKRAARLVELHLRFFGYTDGAWTDSAAGAGSGSGSGGGGGAAGGGAALVCIFSTAC